MKDRTFRNLLDLTVTGAILAGVTFLCCRAKGDPPPSGLRVLSPKNAYASIYLFQSPPGQGYLSGAGTYYVNSMVTIATVPSNSLYVFYRWSDGNTNATRNIRVPKNGQSLTAYYNPLPVGPVALTNAFCYWTPSATTNAVGYMVTVSGLNLTNLTFSTNMLVKGLTNGATYTGYVRAFDTNGLWSSPSCSVTFTAGAGLANSCQ